MKMISSTGKLKSTRGFTLLELIVVTVVIITLSGVLYPRFRGTFDHMRLETEAQRLAGVMEHLRVLAVSEGKPWFLKLDEADDTYAPVPYKTYGFRSEDRLLHKHRLNKEITLKSKEDTVTFYPNGRIDAAKIILSGRAGEQMLIQSQGGFSIVETTSAS